MNKKLLIAVFLSAALTGCGGQPYSPPAEIFPGQEAKMVGMCDLNGGFVRGEIRNRNIYYHRSPVVNEYRTHYMVECANGATIEKTMSKPGK